MYKICVREYRLQNFHYNYLINKEFEEKNVYKQKNKYIDHNFILSFNYFIIM